MLVLFKKTIIYFFSLSLAQRFVHWVVYLEKPQFLSSFLIRRFVSLYSIDLSEMAKPLEDYTSLIDLFTRELKEGVRPISKNGAAFISPCDGRVAAFGRIEKEMLYQAKGRFYTLSDFIGPAEATTYEDGWFVTIYLSPKDYHRVHHPFNANLKEIEYIPGRLLPVNDFSLNHYSDVFSKNRRLIFHYDEGFKMVMVGALNVGDMLVMGEKERVMRGEESYIEFEDRTVQKGEQAGIFRLGSTVILLFKKDMVKELLLDLDARVKMGQEIASTR